MARRPHTASVSDWPSIVISAASGLAGAAIGGFAAWQAACRAGDDAKTLAVEQRRQDDQERKAEVARTSARNVHLLITDALLKLHRVHASDYAVTAGQAAFETDGQKIADARAACDSLQQVVLMHSYLLPEHMDDRLTFLYALMSIATYMDPHDPYFDRSEADVQSYGRFVQLSLESIVHDRTPPQPVDPPQLNRGEGPVWLPDPLPDGW